jgi:uncharacterized phiE125 gp8 family phage protein
MLGAPVTITPPTGELIPIESARSYLRVDGDAFDDELGMLSAASVQDLEEMTGLRLLNQTLTVVADTFEDLAQLRVGPVRSVTSIAYEDWLGGEHIVPADSYRLSGAALEQGILPIGSWPVAAEGSIVLTLEVGYGALAADVPAKLRYAAYALLRGKHEEQPVDVEPLIANSRFWL